MFVIYILLFFIIYFSYFIVLCFFLFKIQIFILFILFLYVCCLEKQALLHERFIVKRVLILSGFHLLK